MNQVFKRMRKPTPLFFKHVRTAGVTLAAVSAALLTAPIALPPVLVQVAGYMAVAGAVAGAVSQTAVKHERK